MNTFIHGCVGQLSQQQLGCVFLRRCRQRDKSALLNTSTCLQVASGQSEAAGGYEPPGPRGSLSTWRRVKGGRTERGLTLLHVFGANKEILAGPNKHTAWPSEHMKYAFGFDIRSHREFQRSAGGLGQTGEETSELKPKTSPKAVSR